MKDEKTSELFKVTNQEIGENILKSPYSTKELDAARMFTASVRLVANKSERLKALVRNFQSDLQS